MSEPVGFPMQVCRNCEYCFDAATLINQVGQPARSSAQAMADDRQKIFLCANCGELSVVVDHGPLGLTIRELTIEELAEVNARSGRLLRAVTALRGRRRLLE